MWEDFSARINDLNLLDDEAIWQTVSGDIQPDRLPIITENLGIEEILLRLRIRLNSIVDSNVISLPISINFIK